MVGSCLPLIAAAIVRIGGSGSARLSLSKTQTRTYRRWRPPRIGKLSTRPALLTWRGIGASEQMRRCCSPQTKT